MGLLSAFDCVEHLWADPLGRCDNYFFLKWHKGLTTNRNKEFLKEVKVTLMLQCYKNRFKARSVPYCFIRGLQPLLAAFYQVSHFNGLRFRWGKKKGLGY